MQFAVGYRKRLTTLQINDIFMTDVSWLNKQESLSFFGEDCHHVPIRLKPIKEARVLWLNHQVAEKDPNFEIFGRDIKRYEQHILSSCAYQLAPEPHINGISNADFILGYADRYGGSGIGSNGGSGRAAIINGYLVKGIGRTPLVSSLTDESHASGGAYLEESVRETIYSEIVRAEFPHSAIPTLAIIDTGKIQIWESTESPKIERRTLLVRPCFIRPAHFERATSFFSGNPKEGVLDTLRVSRCFETAISVFGKTGLEEKYNSFWMKWARQLAYAFIHRLPHGSNTISNICLDGKFLDFGAMSAVPSWANVATMLSRQPFETQFKQLASMIYSSSYFFNRFLSDSYGNNEQICHLIEAAFLVYRKTVVSEVLRLCGVSRLSAYEFANCIELEGLWSAAMSIINHAQKEYVDLAEARPQEQSDWDFGSIWNDDSPAYLAELKIILERLIPLDERVIMYKRSCVLLKTREKLFREKTKWFIFSAIDDSALGLAPNRVFIEQFIAEQIAEGRRDHRFEIDDALPIGFAVGIECSYVIFKELNSNKIFAVKDAESDRLQHEDITKSICKKPILHFSGTSIQFLDDQERIFMGSVKIYDAEINLMYRTHA